MNEKDTRDRLRYTISVAAELVNVHPQTLRHYEREGLIRPQRGKGKIRYFTQDDIDSIQLIRRLVNDLEVNLKGVDVILNMRAQMQRMQQEAEARIRQMQAEHEAEVRRLKEIILRLQGGQSDVEEVEGL
jgi:MerR family transcriptional regulator/heat shock protein HspR